MRRAVAACLLTASIIPVWSVTSASACSCVDTADRRAVRNAAVVFVGVAGNEEPFPGAPTAVITRFAVRAVVKGGLAVGSVAPIVHETRRSACGIRFTPGRRYTVFAGAFHYRLIASSCSPTAGGRLLARDLVLRAPDVIRPPPPIAVPAPARRPPALRVEER